MYIFMIYLAAIVSSRLLQIIVFETECFVIDSMVCRHCVIVNKVICEADRDNLPWTISA